MSCNIISPEFDQIDFDLYNYSAGTVHPLQPHPLNSNSNSIQQLPNNCPDNNTGSSNDDSNNLDICPTNSDLNINLYYSSALQPNTPPYYFDKMQAPTSQFYTVNPNSNPGNDFAHLGNNSNYNTTSACIFQEDNFSISTTIPNFNGNCNFFPELAITTSSPSPISPLSISTEQTLLIPYLTNTPSPQLSNMNSTHFGCFSNSSTSASEPAFSRRNTYHDISNTSNIAENGLLIAPVVKGNAVPYPALFAYSQQQQQQQQQQKIHQDYNRSLSTTSAHPAAATGLKLTNHKSMMDAATASEKKHVCPICNHRSKRKHNLIEHMLTHNPHRPKSFLCSYCSRPFARKYDMKRHEKIHIRRYRSSC